jgi:hypothetical protein
MALLAASTVNEFHAQARFEEVEEWLQAALAEEGLRRPLRARCLAAWAIAIEMRGDFPQATQIARDAIVAAERPSDAGGAYGLLVHNLAWYAPDEAEVLLEKAGEWAAPLGTAAPAVIGGARAIVACARHQYDRAMQCVTASLGDASKGGIFSGPAGGIEATVRVLYGDLEGAEAILDTLFLAGERWPRYNVPLLRGIIQARRGDFARAREEVREAVAESGRWRVPLAKADTVLGCVAIAFHGGRIERASELLGCISAATRGALRSPMSMCFYRHYRGALRAALDAEAVARARAVGSQLSLDAALAAELEDTRA